MAHFDEFINDFDVQHVDVLYFLHDFINDELIYDFKHDFVLNFDDLLTIVDGFIILQHDYDYVNYFHDDVLHEFHESNYHVNDFFIFQY